MCSNLTTKIITGKCIFYQNNKIQLLNSEKEIEKNMSIPSVAQLLKQLEELFQELLASYWKYIFFLLSLQFLPDSPASVRR